MVYSVSEVEVEVDDMLCLHLIHFEYGKYFWIWSSFASPWWRISIGNGKQQMFSIHCHICDSYTDRTVTKCYTYYSDRYIVKTFYMVTQCNVKIIMLSQKLTPPKRKTTQHHFLLWEKSMLDTYECVCHKKLLKWSEKNNIYLK